MSPMLREKFLDLRSRQKVVGYIYYQQFTEARGQLYHSYTL